MNVADAGRRNVWTGLITPDAVLRVLRYGAGNGINVTQLAYRITGRVRHADERAVRHVIEALRRQGYQVCAHPATGYYLAQDAADLDATCEFLYARAMTSLSQISAMKRVALPDLRGQLNLPAINDGDEDDD